MRVQLIKILLPLIAIVLIGLFPLVVPSYQLNLLSNAGIWIINSVGLAVLFGFVGEISFGHAAFFGIGAYSSVLMTQRLGFSFWLALPLSLGIAAVIAFLVGLPSLRTKGAYFALVSFAFGEIVRLILNTWVEVTNGPLGLRGIERPNEINLGAWHISFEYPGAMFYLIFFFVVVVVLAVYALVQSRTGQKFIAIREDTILAEFVGINVFMYKLLAFVISAVIVALGGTLLGPYLSVISPTQFTALASVDMLLMNLLGGVGTIIGPVIGAIALIILPEFLHFLAEYRMIVWGIGLILLVIFLPQVLPAYSQIYLNE